MDWFERLTGFREKSYSDTRAKLVVENDHLRSLVNGRSYRTGQLELVSVQALRDRIRSTPVSPAKLRVSAVTGDVRLMHRSPENVGALFQVASQFNLLEMVSSTMTPEHGVGRYEDDPTQGPACAVAAGAATIYRNYFATVDGHVGQTTNHQLDGLKGLGASLSSELEMPVEALWKMQNGYALCSEAGLDVIAQHLRALPTPRLNLLRDKLQIGIHSDVEVTDVTKEPRLLVSQAFCSALPVAYTRIPSAKWTAFACVVLEGAYEATLLAAALNRIRGGSNVVFLTHLGGGAFGNEADWITQAIRRALRVASSFDLDVRIVSYKSVSPGTSEIVKEFR
jgi:hypothetical protein